jgi:hypothetical protein
LGGGLAAEASDEMQTTATDAPSMVRLMKSPLKRINLQLVYYVLVMNTARCSKMLSGIFVGCDETATPWSQAERDRTRELIGARRVIE